MTVLPWAAEHGTGVIVYSPMASGLLTGSIDRERIAHLDADDWRRESPASMSPRSITTWTSSSGFDRSPPRLDATLPELAVAWTLAHPGVTGAIVGARLPAHVEGWLGGL